jgi:LuxR family maltose regulon positive regulatory protein
MLGFDSGRIAKDTSLLANISGHNQSPLNQPPERERHPAFFFLRTKLLPPRPVPQLLARPRLTSRLIANLANPLTLVTANAGSGKTTLVADFVHGHAPQLVWYQLDYTDSDPFVFLGYIITGIRQIIPDFGEITFSYLKQSTDELARQPERAVDVLLNEVLERVDHRMVLVLDDYHHLGTDTAVHKVTDRLLAYLPDVLHVIIISRDIPPLALARLRSQSSLAIIDRDDLLFTDQETQELFRKVFDLEMTSEQLVEYRQRTHGWITALQLVRQVAERRASTDTPDLAEILRQSEHDIFDYFAEEVFADETEEVQSMLLRIALLDRVETQTCSLIFPDLNCRTILPSLVRRNVFITLASDQQGEEYRLHPLFQSFLRRRLRLAIGRAGLASEYARFADHFLDLGQWEHAVRYLTKAGEVDRAAQVIAEHGAESIAAGALASLLLLTESLPAGSIEKHPRAMIYQAEAMRLRGEYDSAQSTFRRAASLLRQLSDAQGEAEALHSLATIARRRGDYETAFSYLDRAEELTNEITTIKIKCGNTRGLCHLATGDLASSEREFRAALQLAEEKGDEHYARLIAHNLGLPAMVRGDFGDALRWLRRMFNIDRDGPPMPRDATAYLNMARCHFCRGNMIDCEKNLNQALECSQQFNLTALLGEIFEGYGNLYRELGDMARAAEFYERAGRAYKDAGIDITHHELLEEQATLSMQTGDLPAARTRIDQLIDARVQSGNEIGAQIASIVRGQIMLAQRNIEEAYAELQSACAYFRKHGFHYYEVQAVMALAVCAFEKELEGEMLVHLRRALNLAVSYDYEYWLQREVNRNRCLFDLQDALQLLPAELRELVTTPIPSTSPVASHPPIIIASTPVTDLTMKLLGHVEIYRTPSQPLGLEVWNTKRSRDILCFIASRTHQRASKDLIIDTFWGEADLESVEKNFHPTVSHIRKALNRNQSLKQNFLLYRDGDYILNPDFTYSIDITEFDQLFAQGESARRARDFQSCTEAYEKAMQLYRGEFMKGGLDLWMDEPRAYYREQYLRMLETLTEMAQKDGDWPRVLQLAQEILRDDPFREDIHCRVMRAQAALRNRAAVKEQFEMLRQLLRKELGVEPAAETERIYKELMS